MLNYRYYSMSRYVASLCSGTFHKGKGPSPAPADPVNFQSKRHLHLPKLVELFPARKRLCRAHVSKCSQLRSVASSYKWTLGQNLVRKCEKDESVTRGTHPRHLTAFYIPEAFCGLFGCREKGLNLNQAHAKCDQKLPHSGQKKLGCCLLPYQLEFEIMKQYETSIPIYSSTCLEVSTLECLFLTQQLPGLYLCT